MGAYQETSRASSATGYLLTQREVGRFRFGEKRKEVRLDMRRRITLLVVTALTAAALALGPAGAAFADTQACQDAQKNPKWDCKGNKLENPGGHSFGKVPNN